MAVPKIEEYHCDEHNPLPDVFVYKLLRMLQMLVRTDWHQTINKLPENVQRIIKDELMAATPDNQVGMGPLGLLYALDYYGLKLGMSIDECFQEHGDL